MSLGIGLKIGSLSFVLTGATPAAPADLAGNAISTTQIDGTYTPSITSGATHKLSYTNNGGVSWTEVTVTGGTYSLTGLTPNNLYMIRIKATNIWGDSAYDGPINVFTGGTPPAYPAMDFNDARNSMYMGVL